VCVCVCVRLLPAYGLSVGTRSLGKFPRNHSFPPSPQPTTSSARGPQKRRDRNRWWWRRRRIIHLVGKGGAADRRVYKNFKKGWGCVRQWAGEKEKERYTASSFTVGLTHVSKGHCVSPCLPPCASSWTVYVVLWMWVRRVCWDFTMLAPRGTDAADHHHHLLHFEAHDYHAPPISRTIQYRKVRCYYVAVMVKDLPWIISVVLKSSLLLWNP
jgi:hypothetical protein